MKMLFILYFALYFMSHINADQTVYTVSNIIEQNYTSISLTENTVCKNLIYTNVLNVECDTNKYMENNIKKIESKECCNFTCTDTLIKSLCIQYYDYIGKYCSKILTGWINEKCICNDYKIYQPVCNIHTSLTAILVLNNKTKFINMKCERNNTCIERFRYMYKINSEVIPPNDDNNNQIINLTPIYLVNKFDIFLVLSVFFVCIFIFMKCRQVQRRYQNEYLLNKHIKEITKCLKNKN